MQEFAHDTILRTIHWQVLKDAPDGEAVSDKPDRLAIGGNDGFQVQGIEHRVSASAI